MVIKLTETSFNFTEVQTIMGIQPPEASPYTNTRSKSNTTSAAKVSAKNCGATNGDCFNFSSPVTKSASRKRKQPAIVQDEDEMQDEATPQVSSKKQKVAATASPKKGSPKKKDEEKRLRHFRSHAPGTYLQRLERAQSQ
ncbi:MAG: hypothetical protein Q9180_009003, partial [Flavoplaca navasiana]